MLRAAIASLALFFAPATFAAEATERCGVLIQDGEVVRNQLLPGFSVREAELPVRLPMSLEGVQGVICGRDTLQLSDNDYRVVTDLAVPLYVTSGDRVIVLEISSGQFRARTVRGQLNEQETHQLQEALNFAQSRHQGDTQR